MSRKFKLVFLCAYDYTMAGDGYELEVSRVGSSRFESVRVGSSRVESGRVGSSWVESGRVGSARGGTGSCLSVSSHDIGGTAQHLTAATTPPRQVTTDFAKRIMPALKCTCYALKAANVAAKVLAHVSVPNHVIDTAMASIDHPGCVDVTPESMRSEMEDWAGIDGVGDVGGRALEEQMDEGDSPSVPLSDVLEVTGDAFQTLYELVVDKDAKLVGLQGMQRGVDKEGNTAWVKRENYEAWANSTTQQRATEQELIATKERARMLQSASDGEAEPGEEFVVQQTYEEMQRERDQKMRVLAAEKSMIEEKLKKGHGACIRIQRFHALRRDLAPTVPRPGRLRPTPPRVRPPRPPAHPPTPLRSVGTETMRSECAAADEELAAKKLEFEELERQAEEKAEAAEARAHALLEQGTSLEDPELRAALREKEEALAMEESKQKQAEFEHMRQEQEKRKKLLEAQERKAKQAAKRWVVE